LRPKLLLIIFYFSAWFLGAENRQHQIKALVPFCGFVEAKRTSSLGNVHENRTLIDSVLTSHGIFIDPARDIDFGRIGETDYISIVVDSPADTKREEALLKELAAIFSPEFVSNLTIAHRHTLAQIEEIKSLPIRTDSPASDFFTSGTIATIMAAVVYLSTGTGTGPEQLVSTVFAWLLGYASTQYHLKSQLTSASESERSNLAAEALIKRLNTSPHIVIREIIANGYKENWAKPRPDLVIAFHYNYSGYEERLEELVSSPAFR
jgi:hypothetical protein